MDNPKKRDNFVTRELEREIKNLQYKIDTTPRWMGKFIYVNMREKKRNDLDRAQTQYLRLSLCYEHRQEQSHSHYATHNCDHCKLVEQNESFKKLLGRPE